MNFLDLMKQAPAPQLQMPKMDATTDPAKAWQDAVSGKGQQPGFADTVACANSWLSQSFGNADQMDPLKHGGKP